MPTPTRSPALRASALLCLSAVTLPGCIVQDIHDRMEETSLAMAEANSNLVRVTQQLETANRVLDNRLAQIEMTNQHLAATQERLKILESIDASLKALDAHLASLRRTLDNIDSTIPFLNLADPPTDPAAERAAEPTAEPTSEPASEPAADPTTPPTTPASTPTP